MKIVRYNPSHHRCLVKDWLSQWGIDIPDERLFSDYGLIVNDVAIGFLFSTCSKQFYIDHIVTDKNSDKEFRNEALSILVKELEREAKRKGCLLLTVLASLDAMRERFTTMNYQLHGNFGLYYKVLEGE